MASLQLSDLTIEEDNKKMMISIKESKFKINSELNSFINTQNSYIFEDLDKNFNEYKLEILFDSLTFNYYINEHLVSSINKTNKLNLETYYNEKDFEKEDLSCCLDYICYDSAFFYGLPERNCEFNIADTTEKTAYRLFNMDVFDQEPNSIQSLYGSVPILHSVSSNGKYVSSIILNNTSEIWVDIKTYENKANKFKEAVFTCESGILDFYVFGDNNLNRNYYKQAFITGFTLMPALFSLGYHQCKYGYKSQEDIEDIDMKMDEFGIPYDVFWVDIDHAEEKKYFVWDKKNFPVMEKFVKKLEQSNRKLVTIIDPHLRVNKDKKQIVQDEIKATEPKLELENKIIETNEQLENEDIYHISERLLKEECLVLNSNKKPFIGECWPGKSYWADFLNPKTETIYNEFFKDESYFLNSSVFHTWIDMNEPAVFEQEEKTFPRNTLHFNGKEHIYHRDIHNLYGQLYHKTAYNALLNRYKKTQRPFILSRSFHTGTQKFGFIWTGDNRANFDFLKCSVPLLQTICSCGLSACGADVGGFFGEAEEALLKAWYALGVFYPFFRGHCHYDSPRREPFLLAQETFENVKESICDRYRLVVYFYTKFFESCLSGEPLLKTVYLDKDFIEISGADWDDIVANNATGSLAFGNEFIVGSYYEKDTAAVKKDIEKFTENNEKLVELVNEENKIENNKIFDQIQKKKNDNRFEFLHISQKIIDNHLLYNFKTNEKVLSLNDLATLNERLKYEKTAIYIIKGGSIIPYQTEIKQSSVNNLKQNISIRVYLDLFKKAKGTLYLDDGQSFDYKKGEFIYSQFYYNENTLSFSVINLNEMKSKQNYLHNCEFKNIKFSEIAVIGTHLTQELINSKKFEINNLTTNEKHVIESDKDLNLIQISGLNQTLKIQNLEKFNLFAFHDFEISGLI